MLHLFSIIIIIIIIIIIYQSLKYSLYVMIVTRAYIIINKSHMEILCFNILIGLFFKSKSGTIGCGTAYKSRLIPEIMTAVQ